MTRRRVSSISGIAVCIRKASSNDVEPAFQGRVGPGLRQVVAVQLREQVELRAAEARRELWGS